MSGPHPNPESATYPSTKPEPIRNLSEFAVADTPGTSGPGHATPSLSGGIGGVVGGGGGGEDYLTARFAPSLNPPSSCSTHLAHAFPHNTTQPGAAGEGGGRQDNDNDNGDNGDDDDDGLGGGMPTALASGVRGGAPTDETERRATRYVELGGQQEGRERRGGQPRGGHGRAEAGAGPRQNENVDADGKMAMYAEGEVAHAVERAQRRGHAGSAGDAVWRGSSPVPAGPGQGLHGRARGEISLEPSEADLERKKQQQAAARKQVMDARRRGEDVDGRGAAGPSGREPRAEID